MPPGPAELESLKTSTSKDVTEDGTSFSLVLGGPLYQLYLRTKLAKPPLDLLRRRIIALCLICWLPPLLLSLLARDTWDGVSVPFLFDIGTHLRFLVAIPLLVGAESIVHQRIQTIVPEFLERGIIAGEDRSRFEELLASTKHLRNSVLVEVLLLALAFSASWTWRVYQALGVDTWYAIKMGGGWHLTAAGYWFAFVSLPILRFLIIRWYFRLFIWYRFLWRVRGLPLHLNLFHPDRAGGLGFLAGSVLAFAPVLVAQTTILAGMIGNRIWHTGATLPSFKMEIVTALAFLMLLVLTPLSFFAAQLELAGRRAKREYGRLGSHYVNDFYRKWIEPGAPKDPLLGTADIQSLADLGNVHSVVSKMRMVPIGRDTVIRLAIIIILPLLPLALTTVPMEQIIDRLVKLVV